MTQPWRPFTVNQHQSEVIKLPTSFHLPGWWRHYQLICSLFLSLSHSLTLSLSLTSVSTRTVVATTEGPVGPNERWALRGCQPAMASHSQPNLLSALPSAPVALLCFSNGKRTFLWFWWLIATIWRMYYYFFYFFSPFFNSHLILLVQLTGVI